MENSQIEKTIVEQVADLLKRNPKNHDVTFSVGPDKVQIGAVRILLKAASPVFEKEFDENWGSAVVKEGEGIPLLDVDPEVFNIFVNLIISDTWSVDALNGLNLSLTTLLSLLGLCRRFEITKAIKNLEAAVSESVPAAIIVNNLAIIHMPSDFASYHRGIKDSSATDPGIIQYLRGIKRNAGGVRLVSCNLKLFRNFYKFKDSPEFLKMTRENLETIFSCDQLPLGEKQVFDCACRWAEHQCQEKKIETTGENFREVLGSAFFEIRFSTMKGNFAKVSNFKKNLFTPEEKVAIYENILLDEDDRANNDTTELPFKTKPRNCFGFSVLRLSDHFKFITDPLFVCNGGAKGCRLQVNQNIALYGVGFLGPIVGDTQYDVTLLIKRIVNGSTVLESSTFKKQIVARKGRNFHFSLDEPITLESNAYDRSWINYYYIQYSVKGANNVPQYQVDGQEDAETNVYISGTLFNLKYYQNGKPMTEILYKIQ